MNRFYKDYLFSKQVIVADKGDQETPENIAHILTRMYNDFSVIITGNPQLVNRYTYGEVEFRIGRKCVPDAFYRNFPRDVKSLSSEQLLVDQLVHYMTTYGFGDFSIPGRSIFEEEEITPCLTEKGEVKRFRVVDEPTAVILIQQACKDALSSSRPLNSTLFELVTAVHNDTEIYNRFESDIFDKIGSKNTAIKLLVNLRDTFFVKFIDLPDVIKVVEQLAVDKGQKITKLNLKNQDRKFITDILNSLFNDENQVQRSIRDCCESKKKWCGVLHHIHYKPLTPAAVQFVKIMRGKENFSALSMTEKAIETSPDVAAHLMKSYKGTGYVLRNLDYLLSRCKDSNTVNKIMSYISTDCNPIILLQLFYKYAQEPSKDPRTFTFVKDNLMRTHKETREEQASRRTFITNDVKDKAIIKIYTLIQEMYKNTIPGKIYADASFKNIALPISETAGTFGLGSIPRGSRIPLNSKNVRAFTYWEKVNDIDLSCFALDADGNAHEFSWRNMGNSQSAAITFSGGQTSGFNGGSEFFDINIDAFKQLYPSYKYIVFADNVFSDSVFSECYCKAGFMLREDLDLGHPYEPKTVKTSFPIDAKSRMAYLFAIDLTTNEMIWLNLAKHSNSCIAAGNDLSFINKYINSIGAINLYDFIKLSAETFVNTPEEADLIFSDGIVGDNVIHSCDIEKLIGLLNRSRKDSK